MKTFKNILLSGTLVLTLFSCNDKVIEPTQITTQQSFLSTVDGAFSINTNDHYLYSEANNEKVIEVIMEGGGDLQKSGTSSLKLSHHKVIDLQSGKSRISDGHMVIKTESGNELYGQYEYWEFERLDAKNLDIAVNGGTGRFDKVVGNLKIRLVPQTDGMTNANIHGNLYSKTDNTL